jgi:hypothetical protein
MPSMTELVGFGHTNDCSYVVTLYLKVLRKSETGFQDTKRIRTITIQVNIPGHVDQKSGIRTVARKI